MKARLVLLLFLLTACGQENQNKIRKINEINADNSNVVDGNNKKQFLDFFPKYSSDSLKIEVESYTNEREILDSECMPLAYLKYFEGFLIQTKSGSTGAKPLGQIKIKEGKYYLTVVQQDDYGPIYYGLLFDKAKDKIISIEKIAEHWGDAGDTQISFSKIKVKNNILTITKEIETCHADLDFEGDEAVVTNEECKDSTAIVIIGGEPKNKK